MATYAQTTLNDVVVKEYTDPVISPLYIEIGTGYSADALEIFSGATLSNPSS